MESGGWLGERGRTPVWPFKSSHTRFIVFSCDFLRFNAFYAFYNVFIMFCCVLTVFLLRAAAFYFVLRCFYFVFMCPTVLCCGVGYKRCGI